jgi:pyruvate kinase
MFYKRTKIICTIGPASWDFEVMKKLAQEGMDVVRLNMSHGTHEEKKEQIENARKISEELGKPIAVMTDLQGPKIRLGEIDGIREIKKGESIKLSIFAQGEELPMQFDLSPYVKAGHRIFLNDGLVQLKVTSVHGKVISTKALNSGIVSSHKGVNIPDSSLKGDSFTDKDREDAIFGLKNDTDYISMSFVQTAQDLNPVKQLIKSYKSKAQIIVKIEKKEAIENLESIVKATDALMVARGDLAIETIASEVPIWQQKMIRLCRQYQKPVIVATQMLESMTNNPRPTRAETSDVANAVLDEVDCVMLSAESAQGNYPVEAVETMTDTILSVEEHPDYQSYIKIDWDQMVSENITLNAIVSSAASIAYRIKAKIIVVGTTTGKTARLLASFRPEAKIVAVTHDEQTKNQLSLVWGVNPIVVEPTQDFNVFNKNMIEYIQELGLAKKGDKIVTVIGRRVGLAGTTDTIKVVTL